MIVLLPPLLRLWHSGHTKQTKKKVVIVPILGKTAGEDEAVRRAADLAAQGLVAAGLRAKVDGRDFVRPGAKFFEWERKGVPLRLEVSPRAQVEGRGMGEMGGGGKER